MQQYAFKTIAIWLSLSTTSCRLSEECVMPGDVPKLVVVCWVCLYERWKPINLRFCLFQKRYLRSQMKKMKQLVFLKIILLYKVHKTLSVLRDELKAKLCKFSIGKIFLTNFCEEFRKYFSLRKWVWNWTEMLNFYLTEKSLKKENTSYDGLSFEMKNILFYISLFFFYFQLLKRQSYKINLVIERELLKFFHLIKSKWINTLPSYWRLSY